MSMTKKDIAREIADQMDIPLSTSKRLVESFINTIKKQSSKKIIKLKNFGSVVYKTTPQRVGRNPKTKESYIIPSRKKMTFIISKNIKKLLN